MQYHECSSVKIYEKNKFLWIYKQQVHNADVNIPGHSAPESLSISNTVNVEWIMCSLNVGL